MSKSRLSGIAAVTLALASMLLLGCRWYALGDDVFGARGASSWKVTLAVSGVLTGEEGFVATVLPPDFRQQHVFAEHFQSRELAAPKGKGTQRREAVWRRGNLERGPRPFLLTYTFHCRIGMPRPSPGMVQTTKELDAPPAEGDMLKPTSLIESDHKEISSQARALLGDEMVTPLDQVQALLDFTAGLPNEPTLNSRSALECLRNGQGDAADKSRLLVALCRNRGVPARLVSGLNLGETKGRHLHWWAEAWVNQQWWPMCPTHRHFGPRDLPKKYFVLQIGEGDAVRVRGGQVDYEFDTQDLHSPFGPQQSDEGAAAPLKSFWQKISLFSLHAADQQLVKFLLLLPVAALVVSICRTVIGVSTFGIFSPALLGMMFLGTTWAALPWVVAIFVLTILIGWLMRRVLDNFHLLQVPRISAMLTLIVVFLIGVIVAANSFGVLVARFITLFPLVILTHLVERFWTVETEDGTTTSFLTLLGTLVVAFAVGLVVTPPIVGDTLFAFPELLGVVFAAQLLLGRYMGYRLAELYRFRDLLAEAHLPAKAS